ncbi:MAG: hypothetical protein IJY71_03430 [Clostridia bacterium]|nr:hypothetical protein [Clostridia bacterium]
MKTVLCLTKKINEAKMVYLLKESNAEEEPLCGELFEDGAAGKKLYRVLVRIEREGEKREASIPALTDKRDFAIAFLKFLYRNSVSPLSLYDIYTDCLTP